ncbi:hypothetical protein EDB82DRAFT_561043 [Fusarium venenatum]|uniref:uncharacterized protein n=1 Tax=Fusarium venenatum TaxID=56646 RepID=UPI001D8210D3|nr:hypothetical protein EDB82DRAFT_561043 [Fusarium venenatum]
MTSIFTSVNWKGHFGKSTSPYSLYRYKECPTPKDYIGQHRIQAFELSYDRHSKTTSLQHDQKNRDGIAVEFCNTGQLPQGPKVDTTIGWYFGQEDLSNFDWGNLQPGTETEVERKLEKKGKFRWIRENEGHLYGINRPWVIRGYFIGPNENNAPPCITVLCAHEDVARFLVDRIHDKLHLHEGWGATRLPGVKVLRLASDLGSNDKPDKPDQYSVDGEAQKDQIRIEIGSPDKHSMPTMSNEDLSSWAQSRHRCGVQVEIVRDSEVIAKATVGGLIVVGGEVYGLTEGQACGMELDWALVKILGLHEKDVEIWEDVNLAQTVSGEFRPVLIALEEPAPSTHVVLATPGSTHCLRGVFVGPGAIVNIPASPTPYATWVCRMELPWLVQPGDSGSWLLDADSGMLLGILVAGCPELQEAYIIPAHEIIDDIKRHYSNDPHLSINLPNCHPLPKTKQIDLHRYINEYGSIVKSFENIDSLQKLEELDSRITKWIENAEAFRDIPPSLYNLRSRSSRWQPTLSVLQYETLESKEWLDSKNSSFDSFEGPLKTAIQQSPLRCCNFMNEMFAVQKKSTQTTLLRRLWRCLMLGLSTYLRNDEDIPEATKSVYDLMMKAEVGLMLHKTSADYSGPRSPWEMNLIEKRQSGVFPWYNHGSAHRFPESYLNIRRHWYPVKRDYLSRGKAMRRAKWVPWDRYTATEVLGRLRKDLEEQIVVQRKGVEISLPETETLDSLFLSQNTDSNMVLFAVKLMDKDGKFSVILPPPSIGPCTYTQYGIPGHRYPKYFASNNAITYSPWRLPFILTKKSVHDKENLKLLLSTQLNINVSDFKRHQKLNLLQNHSRFYLKEYNQYVDVVIYEGHIEDQDFTMEHGPTGWMMPAVNEESAKKHLSPPFSAILDFHDDDMEC